MIKEKVLERIKEAAAKVGITDDTVSVEHPVDMNHGDFSTNIALRHAKLLKQNPITLAEKMVENIQPDKYIAKAEVAKPGFINVWINAEYLFEELSRVHTLGDRYGSSSWGKGKKWLIEHTSPNPNKAMHLGHLRNNVTGMSIANIWEFNGIEVIRDCIDNNRGIAIAKLMWGYLKFAHKEGKEMTDLHYWFTHQDEWHTPDIQSIRADMFVDQLYVKASDDFKDKKIEEQVRQLVVDWEAGNPENRALWQKVLQFSYEGQALTFKRLGNKWDKVWHEHEHYQEGKDLVQEGLEKKVFKKLKDGAVLTNLENYNLPDTIVLKKDGTSLYITQDLALTKLKIETFHPDKLFWVLGPDHTLAFKQLFAVCEQLGIAKLENLVHIPFGYMSIKGKGKMSSRAGNVVYIEDLLDQAKEKILTMFEERKFTGEDKDSTAEKMAVAAVKYSILKVGRTTDTAFDFETSLSLDGDSGPYLQYTYVRAQSVLREQQIDLSKISYKPEVEEIILLRMIANFQEVVLQAAKEYAPNIISTYLFHLAQQYNLVYQKYPILKADSEIKNFRLLLTKSVAQIIKNGLALLGIETVEKI